MITQAKQCKPQQNMYKKMKNTTTYKKPKAMTAQFIGDTTIEIISIQRYGNVWLK